jgi:DNA-binding CsgD family transcriptional regulator
MLGFSNAAMALTAMPSGAIVSNVTAGIPEPYRSQMSNYSEDVVKQWGGPIVMSSLPLDEPAVLTRVNPTASVYDSSYYREWAEPQGLFDVLAIGLVRDGNMLGSIGMGRHRAAGAITDEDIAAARIFVPHLQRAIAISRIFELKSLEAELLGEVLDTIGTPSFVVDECLTILHANTAGETTLKHGDPLYQMDGILRVKRYGSKNVLRKVVEEATTPASMQSSNGRGVPITHLDGRISALHILPLSNSPRNYHLATRGKAVLFLAGFQEREKASKTVATQAYNFTKAEAKVFDLVADGVSVSQAAHLLGVKKSTIRTHLLHVFSKTGTHRQADIVRLFNDLSSPLKP